MQLTGAQIKKVLEEQWQRDASGNIPARPFLKLGISKGFTYTYTEAQDPAKPTGAMLGTITAMWLNGTPIDLDATYSVTVNSFLSTGGDNFWELNDGASKKDTELTDLQAQVDYMAQYKTDPLQVDYSQRGVKVTFADGSPASYTGGDTVTFDLASLDLNHPSDDTVSVKDQTLTVSLGSTVLASDVAVTHDGNGATPDDHYGSAHVSVTLPQDAKGILRVTGDQTGTSVLIPLGLPTPPSTTTAADQTGTYGVAGELTATVTGDPAPSGSVTFTEGDTTLGTAPIVDGTATLALGATAVHAGTHTVTATYEGNALIGGSEKTFTLTVAQAATQVSAGPVSVHEGQVATLPVTVTATPGTLTATGDVTVSESGTALGHGTLSGGGVTVSLATADLSVGTHTLTVDYAGTTDFAADSVDVTLTVTAQATAKVTAPTVAVVYGKAVGVPVTVSPASATGTVVVKYGSLVLGSATLHGGKAVVSVPARRLAPGAYALTLVYGGDGDLPATSGSTRLSVSKATSSITAVKVTPKKVKAKKTRAKVSFRVVGANGVVPTGRVTISGKGMRSVVATIRAGRVSVRLPKLGKGTRTLTIRYAGDRFVTGSSAAVKVKVTK
jgi:hypothetical protein